MAEKTATSIDEYIARFPEPTRERLSRVRAVVHAAAPEAVETISYEIPTFDLGGRHLIHFAGYEHHIGLYPVPTGVEGIEEDLAPFRSGSATSRFPLDEPLPDDLIRRIVEYQVRRLERRRDSGAKARNAGH